MTKRGNRRLLGSVAAAALPLVLSAFGCVFDWERHGSSTGGGVTTIECSEIGGTCKCPMDATNCTINCTGLGCTADCGLADHCTVNCTTPGCTVNCGTTSTCTTNCMGTGCDVNCE